MATGDKAVAFASNIRRAEQAGDAPAYFAAKTALVGLLDYFRRYQPAGLGLLPVSLTDEYGRLNTRRGGREWWPLCHLLGH
ncbi:hypothetical protein [Actinoplanes sp. NPDC026670]|uniref:hypothetical protein n=1 Tax=Actinoplanes sp. NPDC026670 TaxID=3154700 RepID=UPI0033E4E32E